MKRKPKNLQNALEAVDKLPDDWFGSETASFEDLPSISSKKDTMRTSIYLKIDDLNYLKNISKESRVPVAQITGEIVAKFIKESGIKKESNSKKDGTNN